MIATNVRTYHTPTSLEEAWRLLNEQGKTAKLVGGGVDVALYGASEIASLIDLSAASSHEIAWRGDSLTIGAGATLTEVLESPIAATYSNGLLAAALRRVASPLLRNVATIGGAVAGTHPWSDVITLLLALDAHVTRYAGEWSTVALEMLLADRGLIDRAVISEISLPWPPGVTAAEFEKSTRTGFDIGLLNCACRLSLENGTCADVRVAFGGTPDMAARVGAIETRLEGSALNAQTIEASAALAYEAVSVRDDVRASAAYRRTLAKAGLRDCLTRIAEKVKD